MRKNGFLCGIIALVVLLVACSPAGEIKQEATERAEGIPVNTEPMPVPTAPELARGNSNNWVLYEDGLFVATGVSCGYYVSYTKDVEWHEYRNQIKQVYMADGITSVGLFAFADCGNLQKVRFPNTLETISLEAFRNCTSLKEIQLPNGLVEIEYRAFLFCTALKKVEIPGTITHLNNYVFAGCGNLEEVVIHQGLQTIGFDVFDGCERLRTLTIPESLISIDVYTFRDCASLADIYYQGTAEQWRNVKVEEEGNATFFLAKVHCAEG